MLIFIKTFVDDESTKMLVIPQEKVDYIRQYGSTIDIAYRNGEMIEMMPNDYSASYVEQQDIITIKYWMTAKAEEAMRQFYTATLKNQGAFCFQESLPKSYNQ